MTLLGRMYSRRPEAFKESEVTKIHGLAFEKKGSASAKIQVGEQSFHSGEGRRWLRSENFQRGGQ
jgi:hypothetical protein